MRKFIKVKLMSNLGQRELAAEFLRDSLEPLERHLDDVFAWIQSFSLQEDKSTLILENDRLRKQIEELQSYLPHQP